MRIAKLRAIALAVALLLFPLLTIAAAGDREAAHDVNIEDSSLFDLATDGTFIYGLYDNGSTQGVRVINATTFQRRTDLEFTFPSDVSSITIVGSELFAIATNDTDTLQAWSLTNRRRETSKDITVQSGAARVHAQDNEFWVYYGGRTPTIRAYNQHDGLQDRNRSFTTTLFASSTVTPYLFGDQGTIWLVSTFTTIRQPHPQAHAFSIRPANTAPTRDTSRDFRVGETRGAVIDPSDTYLFRAALNRLGAYEAPVPENLGPVVPNKVTASLQSKTHDSLTFSWTEPAVPSGGGAITQYLIQFSSGSAFNPAASFVRTAIVLQGTTTWTIGGLARGTQYAFRITARNNNGVGEYTTLTATTNAEPPIAGTPTAPTNFRVSSRAANAMTLRWDAATVPAGLPAITGYRIRYSPGSTYNASAAGATATTTGTVLETTISGLSAGSTYAFQIAAVNANGVGVYTATLAGLTLSISPTVSPIPLPTPIPGTSTDPPDVTNPDPPLVPAVVPSGTGGAGTFDIVRDTGSILPTENSQWKFPFTLITDTIDADTYDIVSQSALAAMLILVPAAYLSLLAGTVLAPGWGAIIGVLIVGVMPWLTPLPIALTMLSGVSAFGWLAATRNSFS